MYLSEVSLVVIPVEVSLGASIEWTLQSTFVADDFVYLPILLEQRGECVPVIAMVTKFRLVGK